MQVIVYCLAYGLLRLAFAEEQSLLTDAVVSDIFLDPGWSGNQNSVISPGFKSHINFEVSDPKGDGSGD